MARKLAGIALLVGVAGFSFGACIQEPSVEESEETATDSDEVKGGKKCKSPTRSYVSHSPTECQAVKFYCEAGVAFFDSCGCGCDTAPVGEPCGASTCGADEVCCNASCGICTPPGWFCTQQVCGDAEPI